VIASGRALTSPALRHLAWALQRAEVECLVIADMSDHVEYLRPRRVGDQIALSLRAPNDHLMSLVAKSVFDRTAAAVGLLVLSPLLLVVAIMVRLGSRGPAIFRQERSGRDGRPFRIYKFRTMVVDAEDRLDGLRSRNEGAGPLFKLKDDPRITRLGRVLRRTSIDELPQLINVVKGDMSLVGPRPALPAETSQYSEWVWRRLHVKPGVTGLWQVSGRSALSWEESVRIDLQYVNNWNLRLDFAILARTVRAVLARSGAH
jgi:exopolysaccharide biosynthesis polyprenyl glycosylphosphotransferase